jgi:excisionase family DNA binding protein
MRRLATGNGEKAVSESQTREDISVGRLALSITQAAVEAGIGRDSVYRAIREGRLLAKKSGRRTLILRRDLEAYLGNLPDLQPASYGPQCQRRLPSSRRSNSVR